MIGERFGYLIVEAVAEPVKNGRSTTAAWLCKCDCGNYTCVAARSLIRGSTKSCGCLRNRRAVETNTTHGMCTTKVYSAYRGMIQRCHNPASTNYHNYGARGITVCDRWRASFDNFLADMGGKPSDKHSIDRLDINQGYSPDNCRWATTREQSLNKRHNLKAHGVPLIDIAAENGLTYDLVKRRWHSGLRGADLISPVSRVTGKPLAAVRRREAEGAS